MNDKTRVINMEERRVFRWSGVSTRQTWKDRGNIISQMCEIEHYMDKLIYQHFAPQKNRQQFVQIILNTSVISYGAKVKVMRGCKIIDNRLAEELIGLSTTRNVFAHAPITLEVWGAAKTDKHHKMPCMNSKGVINHKTMVEMKKDFRVSFNIARDGLWALLKKKQGKQRRGMKTQYGDYLKMLMPLGHGLQQHHLKSTAPSTVPCQKMTQRSGEK